ncbi:hypothetical protein [Staphylococcus chromogenes]|uniref:hypothetical protein n=1 Tax=Staphylococcus chromogenes TaxID=46126 RepID=UPI000D1BE59A|nr:hypothetical protein [Staphylococcus chromogenes]PTG20922.1 hypothetical protein BU637_05565 [Staphylococcus chromogenes]PTG64614.1 hypothetical protein BU674_07625 [Staphylococcus chromogenes]RIM11135.1 hypothetical protein BU678_04375 [Staphylococcus chromogenes]
MKKVSNFILASSLVLGFFVTPELFNITQAHAQESVKPYYSYLVTSLKQVRLSPFLDNCDDS